jgi:hypothetical protein
MSDLRHIHDPVLLSLKMEGIRLLFITFSIIEIRNMLSIFLHPVVTVIIFRTE